MKNNFLMQLTSRQYDVFCLVFKRGLSSKEAGNRLGLSPRTIDNHVQAICRLFEKHYTRSTLRTACMEEFKSSLSKRQQAVFSLVVEAGLSSRLACLSLGISQRSVDYHVREICFKVGVADRILLRAFFLSNKNLTFSKK